jgi:hypothetical protein
MKHFDPSNILLKWSHANTDVLSPLQEGHIGEGTRFASNIKAQAVVQWISHLDSNMESDKGIRIGGALSLNLKS